MSSINERIIKRIKISNHSLSQKGLAKHLGKAQSTTSQWLTQGRLIPAECIVSISEYLGCSVSWLLTGNERCEYFLFNSSNEQIFTDLYRQLSEKDKEEIEELIEFKINRYKKGSGTNTSSATLTDSLTG